MEHLKLTDREEKLIRRLSLNARSSAVHGGVGQHLVPSSGNNIEFKEYKSYVAGDSPSLVDWKVLARSDKYVVKTFHEDKSIVGGIAIDISPSMNHVFPGKWKTTKLEAARWYAFYLSQLFYLNKESLSFIQFNQDLLKYKPPSSSAKHYNLIFNEMEELATQEGVTDFKTSLLSLSEKIREKTALYILSDFLIEPSELKEALNPLLKKKIEIKLIWLMDQNELSLGGMQGGEYLFTDSEQTSSTRLFSSVTQKKYHELVKDHRKKLKVMAHSLGQAFFEVGTGGNAFRQFYSHLNVRG